MRETNRRVEMELERKKYKIKEIKSQKKILNK